MNTRKGFAPILIVVILGLVVVGAYFLGTLKKATPQLTTSADPTPLPEATVGISVNLNYPKPNSWKTVTIPAMGISLCLPPKWELGIGSWPNYMEMYFARDPQYRPRATAVRLEAYNGGSRREEYINLKVQYEYNPEDLKNRATVSELTINGRQVLDIAIPSFPRVLVFVLNNQLLTVDKDYEPLVNDSESAFQKDIYTIVGCIESL